ncbi:MAG: PQQ-like beta-propeller repeat protein [Tannerellaceae bacterium]|jgi:outer membrane protein assembly factor BamB|nr:PQQ-like beta-propeller repeat protein [Tannerellaceae bacterium]
MKRTGILCLLIFTGCTLFAQNSVQWRNDRTGMYTETGLLKSWSANGPELLWHFDGLGNGYSSVSIEEDRLFVTGYHEGKGYLYVLGTDGKLQHRIEYGDEWDDDGYVGTRSTVMHDDGKLYIVSGLAELFCYDAQTMKLLWKKNYLKDYGAENTKHGWNGPPLIVGDRLIIAPGGKEYHVVALNKSTGNLIWKAKGATDKDMSGYATPIYIADRQAPQVVAMMSGHIIGVDLSNGELLWSYAHTNRFGEHPNTPVYADGMLFCTSAYGKGSVMLRLANDGRSVDRVWENTNLAHKTGNTMKIGNHIYGSGERTNWHCVDWQTGKTLYSDPSLAVGCIISAEGLLYCYSEKGEMALVRPNAEKFDIISKFSVTLGTEQHWAHPVIYKGVLYVRHGDTLMAYRIKY